MSILVVCPGCKKRFSVSDRFAGQEGPCPNCKQKLRIPKTDEEVTVHAPEAFAEGGRGVGGELLTKPITRKAARVTPLALVVVLGGSLVVLLLTWMLGKAGVFEQSMLGRGIGLLIVSPLLVVAAYSFLHSDDELDPLHGMNLYIRASICSILYMGLWAAFGYVSTYVLTGELWSWFFVIPPFLCTGGMVALACLDLDFGSGFFHYCFYLMITVLLGWLAGLGWVWDIPNALNG